MQDNKARSTSQDAWDANAHYRSDKVATDYDAVRFTSLPGRIFNNWERDIVRLALADVRPGAQIADIPCGTGRLAEPLLEAGYRVHGMDISDQMLQVASRRLARFGSAFTTEVVDAKSLDRQHAQYDAVLCARVLMHFELDEQIAFLRGVAQLTSDMVVINHSFDSPYQRFRRGVKRLLKHQAPARHPISANQLDRLLNEAGLSELRRRRMGPLISEAIYVVAVPKPSGADSTGQSS